MGISSKFALAIASLVILSGCRSEIVLQQYEFTVAGLSEGTAAELERDFIGAGFDVRQVSVEVTRNPVGKSIQKKKYSIMMPGFSTRDLRRINRLIEYKHRDDRIRLVASTAAQAFVTRSADGWANVEVRVLVPKDYEAYLRDGFGPDAKPIKLIRGLGEGAAPYFDYHRQPGDEYVDIVIVRQDDTRETMPDQYVRISLSYPYKAKYRSSSSLFRDFFGLFGSPFGRSDKPYK